MAAWGNLGRYLFGMDSTRGSARPTWLPALALTCHQCRQGPNRLGLAGRSRARLGGSVLADAELARKEAKTPRATEDGQPSVWPEWRVVLHGFRPHLPDFRIARLLVGSPCAGLQNGHYRPVNHNHISEVERPFNFR